METLIGKTRSGKQIRIKWNEGFSDLGPQISLPCFGNVDDDLDVLCASQAWVGGTLRRDPEFFDKKWVQLEEELIRLRRNLSALDDRAVRKTLNLHNSLAEAAFGRSLLNPEFL